MGGRPLYPQDLLSTQQGKSTGSGKVGRSGEWGNCEWASRGAASPKTSPGPLIDPMEASCQDLFPNYQIVPRPPPAPGPSS